MSTQPVLPVERPSLAERSRESREPEWMTELRLKGLELAESLALPQLEKTRIDRWSLDSYGTYRTGAQLEQLNELPEDAAALLGDTLPNNLILQRQSGAVYTSISTEASSQGVIFTDMNTALTKHADLVRPYFLQAVKQDENRLTALHSALWSGGAFLYIPKNVHIEAPFQTLFLAGEEGASCVPHVLIVAEAGSSITYVETLISSGANGAELIVNGVAEIFVKEGAKVRYAAVHSLSEAMTDLSYRRAMVEKDGRVEWVIGEMNSGNAVSDTTSILNGNGSSSDAKVICVGSGDQKLNLTTRAVHIGRASESDMITRAVVRDSSTAIINGITKIEKGATGANGQQTEKMMMLSPKARGDANPILLIDEDDVKAGHAASAGQVNQEQIYYLMSRGISREVATRLIIYGFLAPVVSEIPIAKIEDQLQALVERKLGQ